MEIIRVNKTIEEIDVTDQPSAVCVGKFDGLHRGHRLLLNETVREAENGREAAAVCFSLGAEALSTEEERIRMFEKAGIGRLIILPFSKEILSMEAEDFVRAFLIGRLKMAHLSVGSDFRFGRERKGDISLLEQLSGSEGFRLSVHDKLLLNGEEISSSLIKEKLKAGRIEEANAALGYEYGFSGGVIHGQALGRRLGFPTLNIPLPEGKLLPRYGVYLARTEVAGLKRFGILNIGTRPTVSREGKALLEVHLFDTDEELYGEQADVRLTAFLREEKHFLSVDELKKQVEEDIRTARERCLDKPASDRYDDTGFRKMEPGGDRMLEKIREILSEQLDLDPEEVVPEASFKDDLGIDSLDLFELVMALEQEYDFEIPAEDLAGLATVGDVIDYLKENGIGE